MTLHDMIEFEKEESYDEGIAQGVTQGIKIYISSLREYNVTDEQILESVTRKFGIPKEKAMELMAQVTIN